MSLLEHQDEESIILRNDAVKVKFNKNGYATELIYKNQNLLTNLTGEPHDPDRYRSFYCDYHLKGKTRHMVISQIRIIQNDDQLIHIAFIDSISSLGIEYHIILKNHDSAIYSYIKAWNNTDHPLKVNELRTVYRFDQNLFTWSTNAIRFGRQPTSNEMLNGKKLQDETYKMQRGSLFSNSNIYSKYDYAGYYKDADLWGQAGNNVGVWQITPDKSFYGSGPLNQDLMIHYDGLILNYLFSEHFGKGLNILPIDYKKMYGPWCLYINSGSFEDAKRRSKREKEEWPYGWLNEPDCGLELGNISGKIISTASKKYELVLISKPKDKKEKIIEQQNSNTYYVKTDDNNFFCFDNIRLDSYSLYAYALDGNDLGEHLLIKNITIKKKRIDLGDIVIPQLIKPIWQIGYSSHTTDGFKFSSQLRNYIWQELVPKNLTYYIGQNDDWYYLQNDQGKWKIKFKIENLPKGKLYLRVALAGATQKRMNGENGVLIEISLNGKLIFSKKLENDRSAYRSALKSGRYHLISIPLLAHQMEIDKFNTIVFTTDGYLMYDAIQLGEECIEDE